MFINFFILFLTFIYAVAVFKLWQGWKNIPYFEQKEANFPTSLFISVIIPVRNEAKNISVLLTDLINQNIDYQQFEVVVIDDYSEDNTYHIVSDFKEKNPNFNLTILKASATESLSNKKRSIIQAIHVAKGELIVCTDGDCRVGEEWLRTVGLFYEQERPFFISAPVSLAAPKNVFEKMQVVEFSALVISGATTLEYGYPTMSNGANIAYTKAIFEEVGGFEGNLHLNTGDDEFLMQKVYAKYPTKVKFLKSKAAIVRTAPLPTLKDFYYQRKRWASKWQHHEAKQVAVVALCVFMYHLFNLYAFYVLFEGIFLNSRLQIIILIHFLLKFCIEFVLLITILSFAGTKQYGIYIIPLQLVYSAYVVGIGILSNFGKYHWKGRSVSKS